MMERSLLYQLHSHNRAENVHADPELFHEVYSSKYGKVRIFKVLQVSEESKQWVADPANKKCDVEGGWFCPGQYPPGLIPILNRKKDFAQLEDFNYKGERDAEYQQKYFEGLTKRQQKQVEQRKKMAKRNEL